MKRKSLIITIFMSLLIGMAACNQDEQTEEAENEEDLTEQETEALDEGQAKKVIKDFREVFMNVVNNAENDGEVKDYQSKEELKAVFIEHMSDQQAATFLENYFEEENDNVYVVATEAPFWIEEEKDFALEQVNDHQYEVQQELENELVGHQLLTYQIVSKDDQWMVDDFSAEAIQKEGAAPQDSQTVNNPAESEEEADTGDSTDTPSQQSNPDTEKGQSSGVNEQATEEGPEDVSEKESNGEINAQKAEELVRNHLSIPEASNLHVVMDHLDNNGNYVVQVYEVVSDGEVGHTATIGWYIVNKNNGSIEQMM